MKIRGDNVCFGEEQAIVAVKILDKDVAAPALVGKSLE